LKRRLGRPIARLRPPSLNSPEFARLPGRVRRHQHDRREVSWDGRELVLASGPSPDGWQQERLDLVGDGQEMLKRKGVTTKTG